MKKTFKLALSVAFGLLAILAVWGFCTERIPYPDSSTDRVKYAYSLHRQPIHDFLVSKNISPAKLRLYIRVFKEEGEVELWGKSVDDKTFTYLTSYDICRRSGTIGPKRKQGDRQVPEGYYHIDRFNPYSKYHLSLGVNYPNASDRILSDKLKPGGDIFIHGRCVTIGCVPLTDEYIRELYVYCSEAKQAGQKRIPVTIFPAKLTADKLAALSTAYSHAPEYIGLWTDLHLGYTYFNIHKELPSVKFLPNGRHRVN